MFMQLCCFAYKTGCGVDEKLATVLFQMRQETTYFKSIT